MKKLYYSLTALIIIAGPFAALPNIFVGHSLKKKALNEGEPGQKLITGILVINYLALIITSYFLLVFLNEPTFTQSGYAP